MAIVVHEIIFGSLLCYPPPANIIYEWISFLYLISGCQKSACSSSFSPALTSRKPSTVTLPNNLSAKVHQHLDTEKPFSKRPGKTQRRVEEHIKVGRATKVANKAACLAKEKHGLGMNNTWTSVYTRAFRTARGGHRRRRAIISTTKIEITLSEAVRLNELLRSRFMLPALLPPQETHVHLVCL